MPSELIYDVFAVKGVAPKWKKQIDSANRILKANQPAIAVTAKLGKIQWFFESDGVGDQKTIDKGAQAPGTAGANNYRYSQDQKDLLNHKLLGDKKIGVQPGHIATVWVEGMTGGVIGTAVNKAIWDDSYTGRNGLIMTNAADVDDSCLLHETGHLAGLHHDPGATNVMHANNVNMTVLTAAQKQTYKDAVF